jgi:hypothetical protein
MELSPPCRWELSKLTKNLVWSIPFDGSHNYKTKQITFLHRYRYIILSKLIILSNVFFEKLAGILCLVSHCTTQCFFYWRIFVKFWSEKYDFDLYKGFFMGKKWHKICQISKTFIFLKLSDFNDEFQLAAKNIEGFSVYFFYFQILYVAQFG